MPDAVNYHNPKPGPSGTKVAKISAPSTSQVSINTNSVRTTTEQPPDVPLQTSNPRRSQVSGVTTTSDRDSPSTLLLSISWFLLSTGNACAHLKSTQHLNLLLSLTSPPVHFTILYTIKNFGKATGHRCASLQFWNSPLPPVQSPAAQTSQSCHLMSWITMTHSLYPLVIGSLMSKHPQTTGPKPLKFA